MVCVGASCSDDNGSKQSGSPGNPVVAPQPLSVTSTQGDGTASFGEASKAARITVIDGVGQRPVPGARVEVVKQGQGYLVRSSRDEDAFLPDITFVADGAHAVIQLEPRTADVPQRVLRPTLQTLDENFIGTTNIEGIAAASEAEGSSAVVFIADQPESVTRGSYHVYRSVLPKTLLVVPATTPARPAHGALVSGTGRVVQVEGLRVSRGRITSKQLIGGEAVEKAPAVVPQVPALQATPMGPGTVRLQWTAIDPQKTLLALEVGIDTVTPQKRLAANVTEYVTAASQGPHFACVRAVFEGSAIDPQLQCTQFTITEGPAQPNVQVRVRNVAATPPLAKSKIPVEVTVENAGAAAATGFDVAVTVSSDARPEGGLGDVRLIHFDGLPAGGKATVQAELAASRDGNLYLVAQANPLGTLAEANAQDNLARAPMVVEPVGKNRAPVISMTAPRRGTRAAAGQAVTLTAFAQDPEDGDLSQKIVWTSSLDGVLGAGEKLVAANLTPGVHKIRASVSDSKIAATAKNVGKDPREQNQQLVKTLPLYAADSEATEVNAEFEVEISAPQNILNQAPFVAAGPDMTVEVGQPVLPLAYVSDIDNDALTLTWQAFDAAGSTVAWARVGSTATPFMPPTVGNFRLRVVASDGITTAADELRLTVVAAVVIQPPPPPPPPPPTEPDRKGLVMHLPFNETTGVVAADLGTFSNNGTVVAGTTSNAPALGMPSWTAGTKGGALSLDGAAQHVRVPRTQSIDAISSFTVSAWVFVRDYQAGAESSIVSRQEAQTEFEHLGLGLTDGFPVARVHLFSVTSGTRIPRNTWVHLAATYDGLTLSLYVNKTQSGTSDIGWPIGPDETPVIIGARQKGVTVGSFFNGIVDDARLYSRVLPPSELGLL